MLLHHPPLLQSDTSDKHGFEFRYWAGNKGQSSVVGSPLLREHYENFTGQFLIKFLWEQNAHTVKLKESHSVSVKG
jgi:hypothetical protein